MHHVCFRWRLPTVVLASLLTLGTTGLAAAPESTALTPLADAPLAPDFSLATPDGRRHRLADFAGAPLVVNFWATWCPPCRAEMPAFERAWQRLKGDGIGLIAINVGEDAATVAAFAEDMGLGFALLLDEDARAAQQWPMRGLPTTFILDPRGRIRYQAVGERAWDAPALLERVRALRDPPARAGLQTASDQPPARPGAR